MRESQRGLLFYSIALHQMSKVVKQINSISNVPETRAKLHSTYKKDELISLILLYQNELKKNEATSEFIAPSSYIADFKKRSARNNEEVINLVKDCKAAFNTVKRVVSLPSFV